MKRRGDESFVVLCNLDMNIEDEIYFLFHCPNYSSIRHHFLKILDNRAPNFKQLPLTELIIELTNSCDYSINQSRIYAKKKVYM